MKKLHSFAVLILEAGCMMGPKYKRPTVDVPQDYRAHPSATCPSLVARQRAMVAGLSGSGAHAADSHRTSAKL